MHLKRTPQKSGRVNLSIVDGYYDKLRKHTRQVTIENLGFLDDLQKKYDDPIAFFTKRVEELKKEKAEKQAPLVFEFSHKETIPDDMRLRKNFGYACKCQALFSEPRKAVFSGSRKGLFSEGR